MENRRRITGDAIIRCLYATDDSECYVRPTDIMLAMIFMLLYLSGALLSTTRQYEELFALALPLNFIGFTIRWVMRIRE